MQGRDVAKVAALLTGTAILLMPALRWAGVGVLPNAGIGESATLAHRLMHPLVHVSWWHAAVKVYVLWQLVFFFPLRCRHLLFAYLVACSCPVTVAVWGGGGSGTSVTGVVGLSGMEYVLMGWVMPGVPCRWRFNMQLFLWMSAGLVTGGVAVGFHLYCYLLGVVAAMLLRRR